MNIQEIKARTEKSSPYFFSKETMRFFGQGMRDFKVYKELDGKFLIIAKSMHGVTKRLFNPITNELERVKEEI